MAYVPVFCLYPWSLRHRMPEIAEHARQGMMLFGVEVVLLLLLVPVFYRLVWLAVLVMAVLGAWSALKGQPYRLPLIADLYDRLAGPPGPSHPPVGPTEGS